jgi:hypothetical protein
VPTIQGIDSFQHRILPVAISATNGWYSSIGNGGTPPNHGGGGVTFDTSIKRTADHACSLKLTHDNVTATNVRRAVATTMIVGSVYFRVDAAPSANTKLINITLSTGTSSVAMNTSGQLGLKAGGAGLTFGGASYADAVWHRLDFKADTTGANATIDAQVDGTALTQSSAALASANMTQMMLGDNSVPSGPGTFYFNDFVWSVTSADYPLGAHICLFLPIDGEGTHSQSTGAFQTDTGATSGYGAAVDDAWDGTTPELSQTGEDHVKQTATAAGGYLEFTLADPPANYATVWAGQFGVLMAALDATTADNCECRHVDSAGSVLSQTGLIDPSISATSYSAYRVFPLTAPAGGWSGATLAASKIRWGFSTNVAANPVMNAACVEWVGPWPQAAAAAQPLQRFQVPQVGSNPQNIGPI